MWYSMMYLPLAEATVITFLAPGVSGYICHVLLKDPFTRKEQLASLIALVGVVLIARPASLFAGTAENLSSSSSTPSSGSGAAEASSSGAGGGNFIRDVTSSSPSTHLTGGGADEPTPAERLWGIGAALIGVLGASGAFTTIRWIGKRAHPLISVNYFSVWCTIVSTAALTLAPLLDNDNIIGQPDDAAEGTTTTTTNEPAIRFGLPASPKQWFLLVSLGVCGFVMQFMLTSGLGAEKSNRATAMVYTHMLFAAGFDRWIFGHEMGGVSLVGCSLIIGSALWAALGKKEGRGKGTTSTGDEVDLEMDERGRGREGSGGESEEEEEEGVPMLRENDDRGGGMSDEDEEGEREQSVGLGRGR